MKKEKNIKSGNGKITRRSALALTGLGGALAACGKTPPTARKDDAIQGIFRHGVASGDPLQTRVILWTAITSDGLPATITAEVSTDEIGRAHV